MADENTVRSYRSNDTQRREAAPSAPAGTSKSGDPLADLARLIGQTDPFGDFGQRTPRSNERVASAPSTAGDWRKAAAAMPPYEVEPPPRPVLEPRTSMANPSQANPSQSNPGYGRHDPYQMAAHQAPTADARTTGFSDVRGETSATYYEQDHGHEGSADPVYVGASESRDAEPYFDDGAQLMPQDEQSYDDVPR
ncbi:MAG: hypothetical protein QOF91_1800, partial [Alphaproteobacteria bacterium]|nr:hypothetical protein [Alphaproteobacteria bacterium]